MVQKWIRWFLALVGLASMGVYFLCFSANILINQPSRFLVVPKGITLYQLADRLKGEGYLRYVAPFMWTAHLLRYCPNSMAGHYRLERNMSNWKAIKLLRGGMQYPIKLTFATAEDKTILVEQLTKAIGLSKESLWSLLNDEKRLASYGFSTENILAMFIPNTYEVYWTITAEQLLAKIYKGYQNFWNKERLDKAAKIALTPIQVAILASIVQAETNDPQEAAMIAGVYLNRLKRRMRLESCPTLIYALKMGNKAFLPKRVLAKDVWINSPYNTYRIMGLPPGPIALPSIAMIDAVLNYAPHHCLFFSCREDSSGLHYFSRTYHEHLAHKRKYTRLLNSLRVMR